MLEFNFDNLREVLEDLENDLDYLGDLLFFTNGENDVFHALNLSLSDIVYVFGLLKKRCEENKSVISNYRAGGNE